MVIGQKMLPKQSVVWESQSAKSIDPRVFRFWL